MAFIKTIVNKNKKMNCPKCKSHIKTENINIKTDVAQCLHCETIFNLSENKNTFFDDNFEPNNAPNGTWCKTERNKTIIGATTRSPIAFFLVPFMLIWSGGSLTMFYGSQFANGEFNLVQSLLDIPFIIGSLVFWSIAIMSIWGKVELTLDNKGGKVFTGVGSIGLAKKFVWNEVTAIMEKQSLIRTNIGNSKRLVFEGKRRISFGTGIKEERRYYLLRAIRSLVHKNNWK